jgi:hypothetical protein
MTIADQPPTHDMREADTILRELVEAIGKLEYLEPIDDKPGVADEYFAALDAARAWAAAQKAPQPRTAEPAAWIQPDHLAKARVAPFLCRVEPSKRADFVPIYTAEPAPAPADEPPPLPTPAHPTHAIGPLWSATQMRAYAQAYAEWKLQAERSKP